MNDARATIGETYEFPIAPSGYPAARGNRYEIYDRDERFGVLIGRNLTDPDGIDIHGAAEAWPKAATLVSSTSSHHRDLEPHEIPANQHNEAA